MLTLPKGSVELLYVVVRDRLESLTTLDGKAITWSVYSDDSDRDATPAEGTTPVATGSATNDGMQVAAGPINTSTLEVGVYSLFIMIALPPSETIKLGPFRFTVG